jgi:O-antigen ligase
MSKSNSDIYPLYDLIVKARNHHFLSILIGSGKGTASVTANRYYMHWDVVNNPHSQFVRTLYGSGLIGLWLYLMSFVHPVKAFTAGLSRERQGEFLLMMLVVLGCSLADRSAAPYIYVGMFAAVWKIAAREAVTT